MNHIHKNLLIKQKSISCVQEILYNITKYRPRPVDKGGYMNNSIFLVYSHIIPYKNGSVNSLWKTFLFDYCVSNFAHWGEGEYYIFSTGVFLASLRFLVKIQPMRFRGIPHRLFSLYIAVWFLKNIIGKGLAFLGIQSYNIANSGEYYVFFSLHFNARAVGVLGQTSLLFFVIFEFEKRPQ